MYATNLILSLLVMLPGTVIYGIGIRPSISFYILSVLGTLILPLLPMTLSTGSRCNNHGNRLAHEA